MKRLPITSTALHAHNAPTHLPAVCRHRLAAAWGHPAPAVAGLKQLRCIQQLAPLAAPLDEQHLEAAAGLGTLSCRPCCACSACRCGCFLQADAVLYVASRSLACRTRRLRLVGHHSLAKAEGLDGHLLRQSLRLLLRRESCLLSWGQPSSQREVAAAHKQVLEAALLAPLKAGGRLQGVQLRVRHRGQGQRGCVNMWLRAEQCSHTRVAVSCRAPNLLRIALSCSLFARQVCDLTSCPIWWPGSRRRLKSASDCTDNLLSVGSSCDSGCVSGRPSGVTTTSLECWRQGVRRSMA